MMEINVRLGHGLALELGNSRLRVALNEGACVADLVEQLREDYPAMAARLAACVAVVAGSHLGPDQALSGDDEVALLMPISGG
jgi:molybdopterin converting factor small subunit